MRTILLWLIRGYQLAISPFMANSCRYHPTCSEYAIQAIDQYGFFKGSWLAVKRLARCHPWHAGGLDPVPAVCSHDQEIQTESKNYERNK